MPALTAAQLRYPATWRMIAAAFRTPRSLSPALEGDLAAFCGTRLCSTADFAGAVERVGEVEQGGPALPIALGDQFFAPRAQGFRPKGRRRIDIAGVALVAVHPRKMIDMFEAGQCETTAASHPEVVR